MYSLVLMSVWRRSPLSIVTSLFPYREGSWEVDRPRPHCTLCLNAPFLRHPWLKAASSAPASPSDPLQDSPGQIFLTSEEPSSPLTVRDTCRVQRIPPWKPQLETKQEQLPKKHTSTQNLCMNVHSSIIHNSCKVEATQMPINWWMEKEHEVYLYHGTLFSQQKVINYWYMVLYGGSLKTSR